MDSPNSQARGSPTPGEERYQLSEESVRELLTQAHQTHRAYIDLRFKHFTDYMVTVGILGAAAFKASFLAELRPYICIFGALISILYWRIDYRTSEYIEQSAKLARRYTQSLGAASPPANPARFGSSAATNCLFALFTAAWVGAVAFSFAH